VDGRRRMPLSKARSTRTFVALVVEGHEACATQLRSSQLISPSPFTLALSFAIDVARGPALDVRDACRRTPGASCSGRSSNVLFSRSNGLAIGRAVNEF
jgi:hypothetical protein